MSESDREFVSASDFAFSPFREHVFLLSSELALSAQNTSRLLSNFAVSVFLIDSSGQILMANQQAGELLQLSTEDLRGQSVQRYFRVQQSDRIGELELPIQVSSRGQLRLVHESSKLPIPFSLLAHVGDDVHLLVLTAIQQADLNEYAQAIEPAHHQLLSEQPYRKVVDTQTELICRFTPEGVLTFVNGAYCRLFQRSPQDLVGKNFLELVPPQQIAQIRAQLDEIGQLTADQPMVTHEHEVVTPTGQIAWHQWINQALFDEHGRLVEIQASGRDITEYKVTEQALRDRERQLSLFFTQSLDGVFFMMLDEPLEWHDGIDKEAALDYAFVHQRVTRANQALLDQYGCRETDFLGRSLQDFFAHDLATGRMICRQLFDAGRLHIDTSEMRQDGTPVWIEGDYICLYDERGRITGHFGVQREVTAMRNAVKALSEREQQYRLLVENQTDLVVKVDTDGHFLFVSPSYCELFGKTTEELLAKNFVPLVHPEDRAATQQAMTALWQPPHTCTIEQRALTRWGWRWIAWADTAVVDEAGNVTAITGIGRDITDRKQVEIELQLSEARFRNVLETLPLVAVTLDAEANILFCNDALLALTGWQRADLLGRSWKELLLPTEIQATLQQIFTQTVTQQAPFPTYYENEILTRQGDRRLIAWNNTVQRDADGQVISMTSIGEDITDRKRKERQIAELSQRLTLATHAGRLGVWELNMQTGEALWDERMCEIFGVSPVITTIDFDTLLDQFVHPEDSSLIKASEAAIRQGANNTQVEFRIMRADGEIRYIEAHTAVVRDADGTVQRLIGLNRDVSDRRHRQTILQETTQRLTLATDAAKLGVWEWDIASDRALWDARMYEIYGLTPATFSGLRRDWLKMVYPDDLPLLEPEEAARQRGDQGFHTEFRVVRADGAIRHIDAYGYCIRNAAGQVVRMVGVNQDISDRKQSELALAEALETLNALMQNSPAIIELYDEAGHYQQVNAITARFLGKPASAIQGRHFAEIHSPEVAALFMERIRQLQATNQPIVVEDRLQSHGQERILQSVLFPVLSRPGQPKLLGLVATDITDLVSAQEHLRQQAERERLLREITANIRRSLDLDTVLNSTVTGIRAFLAADRVVVYQFAADWSGDVIVESVGPEWLSVLNKNIYDPCFVKEWIEPYRQDRIHQIADVGTADILPCYRAFLQQYQVRANLVLPLVVDEQLWGLLCVHQCGAPRQWQPDTIEFLRQLCDQVEIAIQQVLLLRQTRIRAQRERVLNEIVSDIRNSLDLPEILERTTQKLLETFRVGRCVISLFDEDDEYFEYLATTAQPGIAPLRGRRIFIHQSPHTRQVLSQAAPVACSDVTQDPMFAAQAEHLSQQLHIGAILSVAIRHENRAKGLLCVQHPTPRTWTVDECTLISQVADQLAIAIQQAELYQQAQFEIVRRQQLESQLRHDALHDSLTGLPNRTLFLERLQLALQRYQRRQRLRDTQTSVSSAEFAVLFLDLDRFKVINDSLGHAFGDQLLQLVGERLNNCLREIDIAARLGGDEFVVLLEELSHAEFAIDVARRIHNILELPIFLDDREVFIRASIGITFGNAHNHSPEEMLQNADIAMYEAKKTNREYVVFDASMHAIALEQMTLEHDLRHAIKKAEFRLYFQPIVALPTGRITGFEALVRWQHPTRGLLYPDAFVEIAEDTGLIAAIDLWVLQQACQQLSQWHQLGAAFQDLSISVNLSGRQFSQPDLINQIDHALATAGLDGKYLKLEITESVLITNSSLAVQTLNEFRARNIQVCMDDFGTGYSSLSYLHQFPVDILKIDKSFILNLNSHKANTRDYEIVKAIIQLALNLNLKVIAEGIENHDVLVYLQKNNCQFGQGYYFSPALGTTDATNLLLFPPF